MWGSFGGIGIGRRPPENPRLDVLFGNDGYLIVNKPADVRMDGDFNVTVEKLVRAELGTRSDVPVGVKTRFVHQLDYATSGVLVLALTRETAAFACKQFERRTVKKTYLAIVYGTLPPGCHIYNGDIAEHAVDSFKMTIGTTSNPGRTAETMCTPLSYGTFRGKPVTKVKLEPHTGRRHQLRVHLTNAGYPIVGDATYAGDSDAGPLDPATPPRMMLHAWRLLIELPPPYGLRLFETDDPFRDYLTITTPSTASPPCLAAVR